MTSCLLILAGSIPVKNGYDIGDKVEDFTLKNVTGEMISLSDYEDERGVILIFDCNTCPYSQAYRDRIKALHATFAVKGFPVVAIQPNDAERSPGDSFDNMQSYAKKHNYKHPYLHDKSQEVTKAFGATNTPHVFLLENEKGDFIVRYIGAIDNNTRDASKADNKYVEEAIKALLNGEQPEQTKTKAIGCTIKWKAS